MYILGIDEFISYLNFILIFFQCLLVLYILIRVLIISNYKHLFFIRCVAVLKQQHINNYTQ